MDIREIWKKELNRQGLKFFVIKADDLFSLDEEKIHNFNEIMTLINERRANEGKEPANKYWVVNRDEPFADEVRQIIEKGKNIKLKND